MADAGIPATLAQPTNQLLATLPGVDYQPLVTHLKPVLLPAGQILYRRGEVPTYVYFVTAGFVSQVLTAQGGQHAEVGLTGREGLIGAEALLPDIPVLHEAMVQFPGKALRLASHVFREHYRQNERFQEGVLRYQQCLLAQRAQSTLCNALHCVEERLSRWLLMAHDRANGNELELTQESVAMMLGVRRAGVTVAAGALRTAGLIDYRRALVIICNRAGLERTACDCYQAIRQQERLLLPQQTV